MNAANQALQQETPEARTKKGQPTDPEAPSPAWADDAVCAYQPGDGTIVLAFRDERPNVRLTPHPRVMGQWPAWSGDGWSARLTSGLMVGTLDLLALADGHTRGHRLYRQGPPPEIEDVEGRASSNAEASG